jgi:hypothetical protein
VGQACGIKSVAGKVDCRIEQIAGHADGDAITERRGEQPGERFPSATGEPVAGSAKSTAVT